MVFLLKKLGCSVYNWFAARAVFGNTQLNLAQYKVALNWFK
jgi:hypothetical protein